MFCQGKRGNNSLWAHGNCFHKVHTQNAEDRRNLVTPSLACPTAGLDDVPYPPTLALPPRHLSATPLIYLPHPVSFRLPLPRNHCHFNLQTVTTKPGGRGGEGKSAETQKEKPNSDQTIRVWEVSLWIIEGLGFLDGIVPFIPGMDPPEGSLFKATLICHTSEGGHGD